MTFKFVWKLIDSDMFEQEFKSYKSLPEAYADWSEFWGISPEACEIFTVELII